MRAQNRILWLVLAALLSPGLAAVAHGQPKSDDAKTSRAKTKELPDVPAGRGATKTTLALKSESLRRMSGTFESTDSKGKVTKGTLVATRPEPKTPAMWDQPKDAFDAFAEFDPGPTPALAKHI